MSGLMADDSAIKLNAEQEAKVRTLVSAEEITAYLHDLSVAQGLTVRDGFNREILLAAAPGTQPRGYARRLTINGAPVIVEGVTELELEQKVNAVLREAFEGKQPAAGDEPARDAATGRFTADRGKADEAAAANEEQKAALQLDFQLGRITASEYIEKSGAVAEFLQSQGIDMDSLREAVSTKSDEKTIQSWQHATDAFLNGPAGSDWPGGSANLKIIGDLIRENNLDSSPSVESLAACWAYMKENGLVQSNPELESQQKIADATDFESIRTAARGGSSLFGAR